MKPKYAQQIERVRRAYDLTVEQFNEGIDPYGDIPQEIWDFPNFRDFMNDTTRQCHSGAPDLRVYLAPEHGMRFLDVGCCANLAEYRLDRWPSLYHGVDISPALIAAMTDFAQRQRTNIGGLWVADLSKLPFDDNSFDIAAAIGVLEYHALGYIQLALRELHRVMKPTSKLVLDIPNADHPHVGAMLLLERFLERPVFVYPREVVEEQLDPLFGIEKLDESQVMTRIFLRAH